MHWLFWVFLIAGTLLIFVPTLVMTNLSGIGFYWLLGGIFLLLALIYLIAPPSRAQYAHERR